MAAVRPTEKSHILTGKQATNGTADTDVNTTNSVGPQGETTADSAQFIVDDSNQIPVAQSGLVGTSFNYINSIIGSGIIGMPFAIHQAGYGVGLVLLLLVGLITDYSLVLMVRAGNLSGTSSYQGMVQAAFGPIGFYILSVMQFVYPTIAMISYNVIIGDTVTKVLIRVTGGRSLNSNFLGNRHFTVVMANLFVMLPLGLYRRISKLAKVSMLSLVFIVFILFCIIDRGLHYEQLVPHSDDAWNFANWGITQSIGIMVFAYMCHHNTFLLYGCMRDATETKWSKATHISIGTAFVLMTIYGLTGYATFTGYVQGDLLENYCFDDDLMNFARFLFAVTIMLTHPLECFVARDVLENAVFGRFSTNLEPATAVNELPRPKFSPSRHFIVTLGLVGVTCVLSMATDCLAIVLELNGVLTAIPLAYILPAASYLKIDPLPWRQKLPAIGVLVFGVVIAFAGFIVTIVEWFDHSSCSHGKEMWYCQDRNQSLVSIAMNRAMEDADTRPRAFVSRIGP